MFDLFVLRETVQRRVQSQSQFETRPAAGKADPERPATRRARPKPVPRVVTCAQAVGDR
jgi:hypothetical protein